MGGICAYRYAPKSFLDFTIWLKQLTFGFNNLKNAIVIAGNATKVYRNNNLGVLSDSGLNSVVVHFKTIRLTINKDQLCSNMANNRCASRVSIGRNDYFIASTYAKEAESHLGTCGLRIKAADSFCIQIFS